MGKRVGITHDPNGRRQRWEVKYPNLKEWEIIDRGLTYEEAQDIENKYIKMGYDGSPGGEKKQGKVYSVYTFEH